MNPHFGLSNGLSVSVIRGSPPSSSDLAICSTDWFGNPGELSDHVFEHAGIDPGRLKSEYTPPFRLFENERAPTLPHVLVVSTIARSQEDRSWSMLSRNLRDGLEEALRGRECSHIWCGPLAAGAARMSPGGSLAAILRALSRVDGSGPRPHVTISYKDEKTREAALSGLSFRPNPNPMQGSTDWTLQIPTEQLKPHVAEAIRTADALSGKRPVGAGDVLRAVLQQSQRGGAFEALHQYLVPRDTETPRSEASPTIADPIRVQMSAPLAESMLAIPDYVRTSGWQMWGRDLAYSARGPSSNGRW